MDSLDGWQVSRGHMNLLDNPQVLLLSHYRTCREETNARSHCVKCDSKHFWSLIPQLKRKRKSKENMPSTLSPREKQVPDWKHLRQPSS